MEKRTSLVRTAALFAGMLATSLAFAVEPTDLDPAEGYEPGTVNIEQEVIHDHYNGDSGHHMCREKERKGYQTTPETTIEYEWNEKLLTGITLPAEIEEHQSTHIGNVSAYVKYTFNPDAEHIPVVAVTGRVDAPTADGAEGLGGEVALRASQKLGGSDSKHQVHLQVSEEYANDTEEGERHARFGALAGYTWQATPETRLVVDLSHMQTERPSRDANLLEFGIKQELGKNATFALGGGPGLGSDSPDWRIHAGIGIHFNIASGK